MRELNLHIGHTKTGSSYIQYFLAKNHESLKNNGVAYPLRRDEVVARAGKITAGNASIIQHHRNFGFDQLAYDRILFSGERLFGDHGKGVFFEQIEDYARRFDVSRINVLLLIRDPIAHLTSEYNQLVKRDRFVAPIDDYAGRYDHPAAVTRLMDDLAERQAFTLTVRNYRVEKDRLPALVKDWLGLGLELVHDADKTINRSLTEGELEILKRLNRIESCDWTFADRLCEELPDLRVTASYPSLPKQREILERLSGAIDAVNARVPPDHRYDVTPLEQPSLGPDQTTLSAGQIRVLRDCIAVAISRLEKEGGSKEADIGQFRAIDADLARTPSNA